MRPPRLCWSSTALLELEVDGTPVSVRAGELFMVAAGTAHTVRPGSRGTLVIVELPEE